MDKIIGADCPASTHGERVNHTHPNVYVNRVPSAVTGLVTTQIYFKKYQNNFYVLLTFFKN